MQKSYLKRCKPKQAKELRSFLYRYPLLFFFSINICYSTDKNYFFCCFTGITVSYLITYHRQIEHLCQFGIFTVHHNGKQIIRMDPEVIILCYLLPIVIRHILQVRNLFFATHNPPGHIVQRLCIHTSSCSFYFIDFFRLVHKSHKCFFTAFFIY